MHWIKKNAHAKGAKNRSATCQVSHSHRLLGISSKYLENKKKSLIRRHGNCRYLVSKSCLFILKRIWVLTGQDFMKRKLSNDFSEIIQNISIIFPNLLTKTNSTVSMCKQSINTKTIKRTHTHFLTKIRALGCKAEIYLRLFSLICVYNTLDIWRDHVNKTTLSCKHYKCLNVRVCVCIIPI